ncbi:MAG: 3-carboxy-cis,cis-muconate cycloisomerase, partial [Catenulispora sp.]|nr:3-carboxy-cis,cis-muconate cycloisomerase [Catenulispora sp.]
MSSADYGLLAPIWAGRPVATVTGDGALVDAMIEAGVALARAQGVRVTPPVLDAADLAARSRAAGDPVSALLAALDDDRLHRGATGQDILDTALMLTARRALTLTALDLDTGIAVAARLAAEHRDTPMAARSLARAVAPTTFGVKAAGWHQLLSTTRRAVGATAQALPVQLGGTGGTLASFVGMAEADAPYVPRGAAVSWESESVPVSSSGQSQLSARGDMAS